jgi:DNA invertase Pin-like site-specific DNA recombinase
VRLSAGRSPDFARSLPELFVCASIISCSKATPSRSFSLNHVDSFLLCGAGEGQAGDVLIVTKIDRLARSTRDLLNTLHEITAKGAGFRSLGDTWADTTTPHGRPLTTVLAGFAEFERSLIITRTSEGRARAKARGQHMGRPAALTPFQRAEALARLAAGTETLSDIGRSYGVSHTTISRLQV